MTALPIARTIAPRPIRRLLCASLLALLSACGGGDGGAPASATGANRAATAGGHDSAAATTTATEPPAAGNAENADNTLNIYNWADYIGPDTIANFERETGIKVRYDVFDTNELLEAKLLAGHSGYDIVVPTANFIARQIQAGVFLPLDRARLTNYGNLDPAMLEVLAGYDPGNGHALPYLWGTTGIGYNVAKIKERMPDAPIGSWALLFDPKVVARFADCGVSLPDAADEVVPSVLRYLGLPSGTQDEAQLNEALAHLAKLRPHIKYFHSSQYLNDLASGEICLALGWNGDVYQARARAQDAKNGNDIAYFVPSEGAITWIDVVAIPKDAPHVDNAYRFLDYLLRPEVAASITNAVRYGNANRAATAKVDSAIANDPALYPPPDVRQRLFANVVNSPAFARALTRGWTRLKTNQ